MITLGVNGISFMDEDSFIEEYTSLVNAVNEASPNTKIILNSIYPVTIEYPEENGITNPKIDAANTWIEQIAENTGVNFLNSASALKDSDGNLPIDADNGDGLHLSSETFDIVLDYIHTHQI